MEIAHSHCPFEHDHPQPFRIIDGGREKEICAACWHRDKEIVEMVPCTPETCAGEQREVGPNLQTRRLHSEWLCKAGITDVSAHADRCNCGLYGCAGRQEEA